MAASKNVSTLPIMNGNHLECYLLSFHSLCKYLTYKEWKPFNLSYLIINHIVSTLPIRNGNIIDFIKLVLLLFFVSTLPIRNGNDFI